jgi:hypothetical protein
LCLGLGADPGHKKRWNRWKMATKKARSLALVFEVIEETTAGEKGYLNKWRDDDDDGRLLDSEEEVRA